MAVTAELPLNQVILGDCIEVMAEWPENSVDCIVTDPPYGIQFMGKKWDQALPPKEAFEQMIRVLKPGALAFVMSSPRQDVLWRMLAMLEGVGFQLRQSFLSHIYKTGFPKAMDISLAIDKKVIREEFKAENGRYPSKDELKELVKQKRKIMGEGKSGGPLTHRTYDMTDLKGRAFGGHYKITEPYSPDAKKWQGYKSQSGLKPAVEMILMVNKPRSEKTIVDNVLKWGTGAMNVDACRIPFSKNEPYDIEATCRPNTKDKSALDKYGGYDHYVVKTHEKGRFPANLIISDGALDTGETTGAGITGSDVVTQKNHGEWLPHNVYGERRVIHENIPYMDTGDQSRYFDLDAWAEHHGFLDVAKPSRAERDLGLTTQPLQVPKSKFNLSDGSKDMRFAGVIPRKRRNVHPTVKPLKLMAYLIELGCPKDGVVVDPFVGSGTTCIAAKRLRRRWIGIEINPEYVDIARARIDLKGPLDKFMEDIEK